MAQHTLRILFVQNAQGIGGSENYLLRLLPALQQRGHRVELAAVHNRQKDGNKAEVDAWLEDFGKRGIPVHFKTVNSYLDPSILRWLWRLLHARNSDGHPFDLIHSHLIYADYWSAMLHALGSRKASVSTIHGYEEKTIERFARQPERVPRNLYWWVLRWSHKRIGLTYACSEGLKSFCTRAGIRQAQNWRVVEHGFEMPVADPSAADEACRFGEKQLAVVGRLIHRKGVHLALEALRKALDKGLKLTLVVVGRGPEAQALKTLARDLGISAQVHFVGFDVQPQRWMQASDAVLVPSYAEGLPLVIFEAFANGKPVIAFDTIGCADLLEHGKEGLLVSSFQAEALAEAMIAFFKHPEQWDAMGRAGYRKASHTYSLQRMTQETEHVYQLAMGQTGI